jgi:glyoxylase-like metal-dependent hydrolase (beta-lactamase superfamily II)
MKFSSMKELTKAIVTINICLFLLTNINAQSHDSIPFSLRQLSNSMYLFEVNGVNIIVLQGAEGNLLVDAGYAVAAPILRKKMSENGIGTIKYLVNTHWHFDHTSGNVQFAKESSVISSMGTLNLLSNDQLLFGEAHKALPAWMRPSIIVKDTLTIFTGDEIVKIISMPGGHTGGDVLVWFTRAGILHIGDIIFSDMFPFIDTDHGGNIFKDADIIASIIKSFPAETRFIPGHGRELNMGDLKSYESMIRTTGELVKKELGKKRSVEELKTAKILEPWKQWSVAFTSDDWIEMIANSIK